MVAVIWQKSQKTEVWRDPRGYGGAAVDIKMRTAGQPAAWGCPLTRPFPASPCDLHSNHERLLKHKHLLGRGGEWLSDQWEMDKLIQIWEAMMGEELKGEEKVRVKSRGEGTASQPGLFWTRGHPHTGPASWVHRTLNSCTAPTLKGAPRLVYCFAVPVLKFLTIWGGFVGVFFHFYWSTIDLQCLVSFRCTAKWICYTYTYIHSSLDSFPI